MDFTGAALPTGYTFDIVAENGDQLDLVWSGVQDCDAQDAAILNGASSLPGCTAYPSGTNFDSVPFTPPVIDLVASPEPGTFAGLVLGLAAMAGLFYRRRRLSAR